ncbi:MAG: DUF3006 domain-containing protein [Nitrososphaerota archaeon]|jgi:hypothetical protein|nr:DUF3006 domain-containing protein [Nitrososphaerota archaeon]
MIIVDRIENNIAICEINGKTTKGISLSKLSSNVREGDVLVDNNGDGSFYTIDSEKTKQRKVDIAKRFERLKARNNIK